MSLTKLIPTILILFFVFLFAVPSDVSAVHTRTPETDTGAPNLFSFFDLRDRETYVQVTNTANPDFIESGDQDNINVSNDITVHVQIWDVNNNCTENNFFDTYTPNDTHVYNMRDIQTNNGNPSGVILPEGAYGIVSIALIDAANGIARDTHILLGNFRILDNAGYEYRTNSSGWEPRSGGPAATCSTFPPNETYTLNFNTNGGVRFSDIVPIIFNRLNPEILADNNGFEINILDAWQLYDVDIFDLNENAFSCRNVVFGCVDEDNPLIEELLEVASEETESSASVAAFEYGINEAIPHSRGGELLCPGNTITEGFVKLSRFEGIEDDDIAASKTAQFIGLNNGNGRGSMDFWVAELCFNLTNNN